MSPSPEDLERLLEQLVQAHNDDLVLVRKLNDHYIFIFVEIPIPDHVPPEWVEEFG